MKIPLYDMVVNVDDTENMMTTISLVTDPAVEVPFQCFDKQKKQPMKFEVTDEDKHCITGVAIRCGYPIYRWSMEMGEYYVRFSKECIENIVFKYSKMNLWNSVSLQHSGRNIADAVMVEYFIKGNGKNPAGFEDIEDGSLFVTYKITDEELWNTIKNTDEINGFSIEVFAELAETQEVIDDGREEPTEDEEWAEFLAWLGLDADFNSQKKKNEFRVSKNVAVEALGKNRQVNLTIGERVLENQQLYQIGTNASGENIAVVYNPAKADWDVLKLANIDAIEVTETECVNWSYNAKWTSIMNDTTLEISNTLPSNKSGKDNIDWVMDRNCYAMISYFDETDDAATGFRTCFVSSWGYTEKKSGSGNECIRIYEYNGDTKSGFEDGRWRFLLTRRIRDFKAADYMNAIQVPPTEYNGEAQAGSGKRGTMSVVKRVAEFPPKKRIND